MSIISRLFGRTNLSTGKVEEIQEEKRQLRGELAQATIVFERRRSRVLKVADEAVKSMKAEGRGQ